MRRRLLLLAWFVTVLVVTNVIAARAVAGEDAAGAQPTHETSMAAPAVPVFGLYGL